MPFFANAVGDLTGKLRKRGRPVIFWQACVCDNQRFLPLQVNKAGSLSLRVLVDALGQSLESGQPNHAGEASTAASVLTALSKNKTR